MICSNSNQNIRKKFNSSELNYSFVFLFKLILILETHIKDFKKNPKERIPLSRGVGAPEFLRHHKIAPQQLMVAGSHSPPPPPCS